MNKSELEKKVIYSIIKLDPMDDYFIDCLQECGIFYMDELTKLNTTELPFIVASKLRGNWSFSGICEVANRVIYKSHLAGYYFANENESALGNNYNIANKKIDYDYFSEMTQKILKKRNFNEIKDFLTLDQEIVFRNLDSDTISEIEKYIHSLGGIFLNEFLDSISKNNNSEKSGRERIYNVVKLDPMDDYFIDCLQECGIFNMNELTKLNKNELPFIVASHLKGNWSFSGICEVANKIIYKTHLAGYYFADEDEFALDNNYHIANKKIDYDYFSKKTQKILKKRNFNEIKDFLTLDQEIVFRNLDSATISEIEEYIHSLGGIFLNEFLDSIQKNNEENNSKGIEKRIKKTKMICLKQYLDSINQKRIEVEQMVKKIEEDNGEIRLY